MGGSVMQLFPRGNSIIVRADYSPGFNKAMRKVPHAEFNGWEWVVPREQWNALKSNLQLEPAHCYPYLRDYVEQNPFPNTTAHLSNERLHIVTGDTPTLERVIRNIEILCGYEEVTDEYDRKARKRNFSRQNITLLERIRIEPYRVIWNYPPGLEHRLRTFLTQYVNVKYTEKIEREVIKPYLVFPGEPSKPPRYYQEMIAEKAPLLRRTTIVKPTGSGKTRTAGEIILQTKVNTLFLTDSRLLLNQTASAFAETLNVPIGKIGDGKFNIQNITIATAQSIWAILTRTKENEKLSKAKKKELLQYYKERVRDIRQNGPCAVEDQRDEVLNYLATVDCLFVDEAHGLGAEYLYLVSSLPQASYAFGLTATYQRNDEKEIFVEAATGPRWVPIKEEELIAKGYLLPVKVLVVPFKHSQKGEVRYRSAFTKLNASMITGNNERNQLIADFAKFYSKKYKTLTLVKEIPHGQTLADLIGVPIISSKEKKIQKQAIDDLANGKIPCLVATSILEQGVDIQEAELLIDAIPRKSVGRIIQSIGRVRRIAPGKKHALVITIYDIDDGVFQKQSERKLNILKSAGFDVQFATPEQVRKIRSLANMEGGRSYA